MTETDAQVLRVTVLESDAPPARTGDCFVVRGTEIQMKSAGFDFALLVALAPLLLTAQAERDPGSWIRRKPWFVGPDEVGGSVVRLEWITEKEAS